MKDALTSSILLLLQSGPATWWIIRDSLISKAAEADIHQRLTELVTMGAVNKKNKLYTLTPQGLDRANQATPEIPPPKRGLWGWVAPILSRLLGR